MELILNLVGAVVCASMARRRGRGPVRWFFLGLLFHVVAIGVLFFLGYRDRSRAVAGSTVVTNWPDVPQGVVPSTRTQQRGQVDLNALRAAVRGGGTGQQGPTGGRPQPDADLAPDRRAFLELIEQVGPTIDFSSVSPQVGRDLRDSWLELGRVFVRSGEAGGITDSSEFYQLDVGRSDLPVLFYPVALDPGVSRVVIQFACPVKRFRRAPRQLVAWVETRPHSGFADATLFQDPTAGEVVLLAAGTRDPASTPVNEQTLGEWCRQVRLEAEGLKRDVPSRFGGIWV